MVSLGHNRGEYLCGEIKTETSTINLSSNGMEFTNNLIVKSPDGTKYKLTVDDNGILSTEEVL